jgi:hypothetical protein
LITLIIDAHPRLNSDEIKEFISFHYKKTSFHEILLNIQNNMTLKPKGKNPKGPKIKMFQSIPVVGLMTTKRQSTDLWDRCGSQLSNKSSFTMY